MKFKGLGSFDVLLIGITGAFIKFLIGRSSFEDGVLFFLIGLFILASEVISSALPAQPTELESLIELREKVQTLTQNFDETNREILAIRMGAKK